MLKIAKSSSYINSIKSIVTIGTFDGVHIGHQKILNRLVEKAAAKNLKSVLLTFFPHPRMVLQKEANLKMITTISERAKLIENLGLDVLVIEHFTKAFSRLTAENFVKQILIDNLKAAEIIIGYDHRFGRNRSSDVKDLINFGKTYNFLVEEISKEDVNDVAVSSTKIREALDTGQIEIANRYLGYNFMITGKVVEGKKIGRNLGFPTANIYVEETYKLIPKQGVYVVKSILNNKAYFGMMNIGTNPTLKGELQTIEAHFFDFDELLYGKVLKIELLRRLRDEQKFDSAEALQQQLNKDKTSAIAWTKQR